MKIIAVEISVEHVTDEPSVDLMNDEEEAVIASHGESFTLTISQEVGDDESAAPHIEKAAAELLRRYRTINARKTN
jgi:hypothetical protein